MKTAARRDCESETMLEKCGKTSGERSSTRMTTVPPSTRAAQRRRRAKKASGVTTSAAIGTAPSRSTRAGARVYRVSEWMTRSGL